MQVQQIRIQTVVAAIGDPSWLAAFFQILISLQDFDDISTDSARIALINQIIAAINEAQG